MGACPIRSLWKHSTFSTFSCSVTFPSSSSTSVNGALEGRGRSAVTSFGGNDHPDGRYLAAALLLPGFWSLPVDGDPSVSWGTSAG